MAEQSQQNVVVQPQSMDASPSVDVYVNNPTNIAASAAVAQPQFLTNDTSRTEASIKDNSLPASGTEIGESNDDAISKANRSSIEGKDSDALEFASVRSGGPEGSVGSDTDTSKADAVATISKESDGQIPKYSAKKSAFKPVSVTKNFLAKAGSSTTPVKSSNERANSSTGSSPAPSSQNALRPRLVAKSVSGQRGSIPKSMNATDKSGAGSGPDPNQVWNRNRVSTPQATPKHLTDEELRQQYGIQLASRPDESDDKGAKWADIDDEEDDWAPETIEWNDGTKINLAPAESSGSNTEIGHKDPPKEQLDEKNSKPVEEIAKPTTVGPNATVLKLGAASHHKSTSISTKGSSDKPTLVAKPSAAAPPKSPWATLPAVDKVPPVPINPPAQPTQQLRFGQKDAHGFDAMPPPPGAGTKEIAADDFSRFSRDTPNGNPRELYVPQSGRYEPVHDSRRGSARKESTFRQPSVLQRPPQNEQQGPAEPSAAFQTNRSQQDSGPWSRRRASSNVSGESGRFGRQMSISKPSESPIVPSRRNSHFDPFAPAVPRGPQREASPAQSQGKSITSQSPTMSSAPDLVALPQPQQDPASNSVSAPSGVPEEDPVAVQKRLMREKREAAIKRKKEEEEREEAERRERIRIKMEKLGLTDEKMGKKDSATPGSKLNANEAINEKGANPHETKEAKGSKDARETPASAAQPSPPKPPVPSASGPPQQYGLMKVHAAQPLSASISHSSGPAEKSLLDAVTEGKSARPTHTHPPLGNGSIAEQRLDTVTSHVETRQTDASPDARPWVNLQQATSPYPAWSASGGMATHSSPGGNLWGPPTNHRALGNGDFQNNLQRASLRPPQPPFSQQHLTPPPPQPIGTPRQAPQTRGSTSANSTDLLPRSIIEDSQTVPAFPSAEDESIHLPSHLRNEQASTLRNSPDLHHHLSQSSTMNTVVSSSLQDQPQTGRVAWANFSTNVGRQERETAERTAQEHASRMAEQQLSGIVPSSQLSNINETWKQVKRGDMHGTRQVINHAKSQDNYAGSGHSQNTIGELAKAPPTNNSNLPVRSRYSDFFGQDQHAATTSATIQRPNSPSAPPPDSLDHPAYVGMNHRPLVNLPRSKPHFEKPIVKLPPTNLPTSKQTSSANTDARVVVVPNRGVPQPIVSNPSWQDRFNNLFSHKPLSAEKRVTDATGFSSSKEPLELPAGGIRSTAVTLPPESSHGAKEGLVKSVEEENALFEERDFGSVPITKIPPMFPDQASWEPAKEPTIPFKRAKALALKDHDIYSISHISPVHFEQLRGSGINITILIPGMLDSKSKTLNRPVPRYPSRGGKPHQGKQRQGPRPIKEPHSSQMTSGRSGQNNGNRPQPQNAGTPKSKTKLNNTHTTWGRHASAVAQ